MDVLSNQKFIQLPLEDRLKICMYGYTIGIDLVDNPLFEAMLANLPDDSPLKERHWESVSVEEVTPLFEAIGEKVPVVQESVSEEEWKNAFGYLRDMWSKNKSITMIETISETKNILSSMMKVYSDEHYEKEVQKLLLLLKYDGWNITIYYVPGNPKPVLIHTRARTGKPIFCTSVLRDIMPEVELADDSDPIKISGELCLDEEALTILKEYYSGTGKEFVNTRNSISSVVFGTVDVSLIKEHIHFYAFLLQDTNGNVFDTVSETMDFLDSIGFETPYRMLLDSDEDFDRCFEQMTRYYKVLEKSIQCDGVVAEPNHFAVQQECYDFVAGDNQAGLIAIKAEYWSNKVYVGEVIDIISPPSEQNRSLVAIIAPVKVSNGNTVRRVPLINLRRAHAFGDYVDLGDHILFTYHSQQNIHFEGFEEAIK